MTVSAFGRVHTAHMLFVRAGGKTAMEMFSKSCLVPVRKRGLNLECISLRGIRITPPTALLSITIYLPLPYLRFIQSMVPFSNNGLTELVQKRLKGSNTTGLCLTALFSASLPMPLFSVTQVP